ncbi:MAG TPA: hypothetical protein VGD58_24745 [Herpetosiphonaceae bacterium]
MTRSSSAMDVYLEVGTKRVFAGAIDWPGWTRGGKDEESALQALAESAPRYARLLKAAKIDFKPPKDASAFNVVERVEGNSTTEFGAPNVALASDAEPIDEATLERFQNLLTAYWQGVEAAIKAAIGKELRKGPRGGGRELDTIIHHVIDANYGYLRQIAWKAKRAEDASLQQAIDANRQAIHDALAAAVHDGVPEHGPRGGKLWKPRTFVRRAAWHMLDHIWEIEDRIE